MLFKIGDWTSREMPCEILYSLPGGHMAELYVAKLKNTEHLVVVKAVRVESTLQRFLVREAKILSGLRYEGIPEVFGCTENAESCYYIMSYHRGVDLEQYVQQHGCMPEEQVRKIAMELCGILAYLHSKRISVIHNDLKPSNILLQEDGSVVLLDFGLAECLNVESEEMYFQGTLGYAAPECWHRETQKICPATDIFALGATMFYLLEAKKPRNFFGKFVLTGENIQKKNWWQPVLNKCCALDVRKRFQSAAEVYEVLSKMKV